MDYALLAEDGPDMGLGDGYYRDDKEQRHGASRLRFSGADKSGDRRSLRRLALYALVLAGALFVLHRRASSDPSLRTSQGRDSDALGADLPSLAPPANAKENMPWPLPVTANAGQDTLCLDSRSWTFLRAGACAGSGKAVGGCATLERAFARYKELLFAGREPASEGCLASATVTVASSSDVLDFGVDERYTLEVSSAGVTISAKTIFGAMYGLESLSQLVRYDAVGDAFHIPNAPWTIDDWPRFPHREILVDTGRHFLPVVTLKHLIASLPAAKINTLHWHLEDDQSWPICLKSLPDLCKGGAFGPNERYSVSDVKQIVSFARDHGVRVVPEIDLPGHTKAVCRARPDLCVSSGEMISPAGSQTMEVLHMVMQEVAELFPDSYIHLGGDEVNVNIWGKDPATLKWMGQHQMNGKHIYAFFVKTAHEMAIKLGKIPVGWSEIWAEFGTSLDQRSVLHKWRHEDSIADIVSNGYHALWSDYNSWYLDILGSTWDKMYMSEPCEGLKDEQCKLVIGGGGEMWGETADTSDIMQTVWPRLGAIGERLWSRRAQTTSPPGYRMAQLRCLLNRRGVAAAPVLNRVARSAPPGPGACDAQ